MSSYADEEAMEAGGYNWIITEDERTHIASLLNVEESDIKLKSNPFNRSRATCSTPGCCKRSGIDDFLQNAQELGVHDVGFLHDIFCNMKPAGGSPAHALKCSNCGEAFDGTFAWGGGKWFG